MAQIFTSQDTGLAGVTLFQYTNEETFIEQLLNTRLSAFYTKQQSEDLFLKKISDVSLNMNGFSITNLSNPVDVSDAVNLGFLENELSKIDISLSLQDVYNVGQTIDLSAGMLSIKDGATSIMDISTELVGINKMLDVCGQIQANDEIKIRSTSNNITLTLTENSIETLGINAALYLNNNNRFTYTNSLEVLSGDFNSPLIREAGQTLESKYARLNASNTFSENQELKGTGRLIEFNNDDGTFGYKLQAGINNVNDLGFFIRDKDFNNLLIIQPDGSLNVLGDVDISGLYKQQGQTLDSRYAQLDVENEFLKYQEIKMNNPYLELNATTGSTYGEVYFEDNGNSRWSAGIDLTDFYIYDYVNSRNHTVFKNDDTMRVAGEIYENGQSLGSKYATISSLSSVEDDVADVSSQLNSLEGTVNTNTGNISTNTGNISTNTSNISTNTNNINSNSGSIIFNAQNISSNTGRITTLENENFINEADGDARYVNKSGDTVTGQLKVIDNGENIQMEGTDHVYMAFYPEGFNAGRKAYIGFPNVNITELTIFNQYTSGIVNIHSSIKEGGTLLTDKYVNKSGDTMSGDLQLPNLRATNSIGIGSGNANFGSGWDDGWLLIEHKGFDGDIGNEFPNPEGGVLFAGLSSANKLEHGHYFGIVKDLASTNAIDSYRLDFGTMSTADSLGTNSETETFNPNFTIDGGGNVGIGTVSPDKKLHIKGDDEMIKLEGVDNPYISFYNGSSTRTWAIGTISSGNDHYYIFNPSGNGGDILLASNKLGNVGIGTDSPGARLDVDGNVRSRSGSDHAQLTYFGVEFNRIASYLRPTVTDATATLYVGFASHNKRWKDIYFDSIDSTFKGNVTGDGQLFLPNMEAVSSDRALYYNVSSGQLRYDLIVSSDERIKTNVEDISKSKAFNDIMNLRPVKYEYTDEWRNHMNGSLPKSTIGFIAQEVIETISDESLRILRNDIGDIVLKNQPVYDDSGNQLFEDVSYQAVDESGNVIYKDISYEVLDESGNTVIQYEKKPVYETRKEPVLTEKVITDFKGYDKTKLGLYVIPAVQYLGDEVKRLRGAYEMAMPQLAKGQERSELANANVCEASATLGTRGSECRQRSMLNERIQQLEADNAKLRQEMEEYKQSIDHLIEQKLRHIKWNM